MNFYFYILHLLQPNVVSLQVPIYIEASDIKDAQTKADTIKNLVKTQFDLLFEPSAPILYNQSINGPSFGSFFTKLGNGQKVILNLPINFSINFYQFNHANALTALDALILVPGSHAPVYSL